MAKKTSRYRYIFRQNYVDLTTGFLNQKIRIYENNPIANPYGGTDPNNTIYWETYAEVAQLVSTRNLEANQALLKMVFTFKIRYRKDKNIQNDMLLYWRGCWFTIQGYVPDVVNNVYVIFDGNQMNPGNLVTT